MSTPEHGSQPAETSLDPLFNKILNETFRMYSQKVAPGEDPQTVAERMRAHKQSPDMDMTMGAYHVKCMSIRGPNRTWKMQLVISKVDQKEKKIPDITLEIGEDRDHMARNISTANRNFDLYRPNYSEEEAQALSVALKRIEQELSQVVERTIQEETQARIKDLGDF